MSRAEIEEEAKRIVGKRKELITEEYNRTLRRLKRSIDRALEWNHRRLLVIAGGSPGQQALLASRAIEAYARRAVRRRGRITFLYMYHDEFEEARLRKEVLRQYFKRVSPVRKKIERAIDVYERTDRYLGTTYDALVLDLTMDFKPNDVGRLVEIVRGGGLLVFIVPLWSEWDRWMTLFKQKLLVPGFREPRHIFLRWVKTTLEDSDGVFIFDVEADKLLKASRNRRPAEITGRRKTEIDYGRDFLFHRKVYGMTVTQDQLRAVRLMEKLVEKPERGRKTVLVITADRGRGKSCALGIGLIGVAEALKKYKHKVRVIVTAPSPSNLQSLFDLAYRTASELGLSVKPVKKSGYTIELQGPGFSIEYWEPIVVPRLRGDVIAVDEASGVHVPLLLSIHRSHSRVVYTATLHGYEGAGRGFSVRFLGFLRKDKKTTLHTLEMKEPIRYSPGDPIEKWLYRTLLLDAEPAVLDENDYSIIRGGDLEYRVLEPEAMFTREGEEKLRAFFGIYVLAHYRNQPDDLGLLADAPHHEMRAVFTSNEKIVGSVQIAFEGNLDEETIESLLRGNKIPGNIVPDRMLKHHRIIDIGYTRGYRIVRIASHPDAQDMGIGSFALRMLYEEARKKNMDWLGSGFGVNPQLLRFWVKNGFIPVHMSPDRNPVSGEYTILVIKPIAERVEKIVSIASANFVSKLVKSLRDTYRDLEPETVRLILDAISPYKRRKDPPFFTRIDLDRLWIYSYGPMTYEALSDLLWELSVYYFLHDRGEILKLDDKEEALLIMKVLQGREWEEVGGLLKMRLWDVMMLLKNIVARMLEKYYSIDRNAGVGVKLEELLGPGGR